MTSLSISDNVCEFAAKRVDRFIGKGPRRVGRRVLTLALGLLISMPLVAQTTNPFFQQYRHSSWGEKDGLYGAVTAVTQTTDGYLWVAADSGLFRFDGMTFEAYRPRQGLLPDGAPTRLFASPDGGLWASYTGSRIVLLKDAVATTYTEKDGYPYGLTKDILQTHDGAIWAAVVGGLARFDGKSWHKIRGDWKYTNGAGGCLFVDRQDTLWVCSGTDLSYLPSGSHEFKDLGLKIDRIVTLRQAHDGMLWLSDANGDRAVPFRSPLESGQSAPLPEPVTIGAWALLFPSDGSFWFGSERGVRRMPSGTGLTTEQTTQAKETAETFNQVDGASDRIIRCLFEDREGNIWAGTRAGLDRFSGRRLAWSDTREAPRLVAEDDGELIVSYDTDVPPERFSNRKAIPLLDSSIKGVYTSSRSADGSVWFMKVREAWRWKGGVLQEFSYPRYDKGSRIYAIATDRLGTIWASISGLGLMQYKDGNWVKIAVLSKDSDIAPQSIFVQDEEHVWVGYADKQRVALINSAKVVKVFGPEDGLALGQITDVTEQGGSVWAVGRGGLALLRGSRFITLTDDKGSPYPRAYRVAVTPNHGLWISSTKGIVHVSGEDLRAYLDGRSSGMNYEVLDTAGDLPEPLAGQIVASLPLAGSESKLWFATIGGVATIDLDHLQRNTLLPPVVITSLNTDKRSYQGSTTVTLPPRTRSFTVAYTALSLSDANRNRFKVRLDGWDKQWQDVGARREALYSNLGPGTYLFHVIACNNDGFWNETGAAITVKVLPAYYQTYWFLLLCLLAIGLIGWAFYTWRVKQLIERSNDLLLERISERERIAHDLHDTFLQSVQGLLLRFHSAVGQLPHGHSTRTLMEETLVQSDKVMLEGRGLVLDLHTSTHAGGELLEQLQSIGEEYLAFRPLTFHANSNGPDRTLNAIIVNEVCSFGREALSNAFRHSNANNIQVVVRYEKSELVISFKDDGRGIETEVLEAGHRVGHWGLLGMKERASRLGATAVIRSSAQTGTEIELRIPAVIAYAEHHRTVLERLLWSNRRPNLRS